MMRRFATTLGVGMAFLLALNCENGYPIAPTLCDRVCEGEQRLHCDGEDPIACIDSCEVARNPRCEARLTALTRCINALPLSAFECQSGSTRRQFGTCNLEAQLLQTCSLEDTSGWRSVCDDWATKCISGDVTGAPDAGSSPWELYLSCVNRYQRADNFCRAELQGFVECLDLHEMSCETNPADRDVCQTERAALEKCDAPLKQMCEQWRFTCLQIGAPPDEVSEERCLQSRPVDTGLRCAQERSALYKCAENESPWLRDRCRAPPLAHSICADEHFAFDTCAAGNISASGAAR
jgi:hypothetical protein